MNTINIKLEFILFGEYSNIFKGCSHVKPFEQLYYEMFEDTSFDYLRKKLMYAINNVRRIFLVSRRWDSPLDIL